MKMKEKMMNNSLTVSNIITEKLKEFGVFGAEAIANNVVEHLNKAGYLLVENWLTHGQFDNMNNDTINLSLSDLDANLITFDSNLIAFDETTSSGSLLNGNTDDIIVLDFNNMLPSDHFAGSHMNVTNIRHNNIIFFVIWIIPYPIICIKSTLFNRFGNVGFIIPLQNATIYNGIT